MESKNIPSTPRDTSLRYNLAVESNIEGARDSYMWHPSGEVRIFTYPPPSPQQELVAEHCRNKGLILGTKIDSTGMVAYSVPAGARPIEFEAKSRNDGALDYGDAKMFAELGTLLGEFTKLLDTKWIYEGDVVRSVALVDYTEVGERRLFLIPGFELLLRPNDGAETFNHKSVFEEQLMQVFGQRLIDHQDIFRTYFNTSLS